MSDSPLAIYESIAVVSAGMRDAARAADWDALVDAEHECRRLVEAARGMPREVVLDAAARERKAAILRAVLANDAEIRDLAQPRLAELARMLKLCAGERKVRDAYR